MREAVHRQMSEAAATHWWFRGRRRVVEALLRQFAPGGALAIADVGCGTGTEIGMLRAFGRVVGIDSSDLALQLAHERGHGELIVAAIPRLCFPDGAFDVVCALDVIEHIEDDRAAVYELWRVVRPGGLLMVTVPAYPWLWSEHDDANQHRRRYTRAQLRARLSAPGCTILKLSYMSVAVAPAVVAVRLVKNLTRWPGNGTRAPRLDLFSVPRSVNAILVASFTAEALWLRHGRFPFGTSIVCVARKARDAG
jgi:SAM-dependent methyltransferase